MADRDRQVQRWSWFLDVVFGAVVALGIQKYEPVIRAAWHEGAGPFALSLFVAVSVCSFVVYDIAVYHVLVKKYPYQTTPLGFVRFYLDLVMAIILYVLLANALKADPDWAAILAVLSFWHIAAVIWHLMARQEHKEVASPVSAIRPHLFFVAVYWLVAILAATFGSAALGLDRTRLPEFVLAVVSATILAVSLFRWNQVLQNLVSKNPAPTRKKMRKAG